MNKYYFEQQKLYEEKYGENTIVLIMKGSFYECYEYESYGKASIASSMLNTLLTKANKSKPETDVSNPLMTGFGVPYLKKFLKPLLDNNFTVVTIDQEDDIPNKKGAKTRDTGTIYSPGVYLDSLKYNNVIMCVYSDDEYMIGVTTIDLCTGCVNIYEIIEGKVNKRKEELTSIIETINPEEIVFISDKSSEAMKQYFKTDERHCHFKKETSIEYNRLAYQNEVLKKIYNVESLNSAIEYLELSNEIMGRISLIYLLEFCHDHDKSIIKHLKKPNVVNFKDCLILHNNAVYQINVVNKSKEKSLFNVLDNTSTPMGKRKLFKVLQQPISDAKRLEEMYEETEKMIDKYKMYEEHLKKINDIERLHRKVALAKLLPSEMQLLMTTYYEVLWILKESCYAKKEEFEIYDKKINSIFDIELLYNNDYELNFFRKEQHEDIDKMFCDLKTQEVKLETLSKKMNEKLGVSNGVKIEINKQPYNINCTIHRSKLLKSVFTEYTYKNEKSKCVISNNEIENIFHKISNYKEKLKPILEKRFQETLTNIFDANKTLFEDIHEYIGDIDFCKSRAKSAVEYDYKRPILVEENCLRIKGLRHPIIERFSDCEYVPNDVMFDSSNNGVLLYGVNGAGKSCYAKSVGLSVVMAQSGHFVCAEEMEYRPYERLYTRISDSDNIYKGQSSFFVELYELKSIIHYANERCLILGDEVCRGTEDISALTLVATTLQHLLKLKSTFIFATHLHKLPTISFLSNNKSLKIKHIEVQCDKEKDIINFTRVLKEGQGESFYGLDIAKLIIEDDDFMEKCNEVKNEVLKKQNSIIKPKRSNYNKEVFMDSCYVCEEKTNLESHHIRPQSSSSKDSKKVHSKSNIVVLCGKCHDEVHNGKLEIKGWKQTTKGKILDFIKK